MKATINRWFFLVLFVLSLILTGCDDPIAGSCAGLKCLPDASAVHEAAGEVWEAAKESVETGEPIYP